MSAETHVITLQKELDDALQQIQMLQKQTDELRSELVKSESQVYRYKTAYEILVRTITKSDTAF